MRAADTPPVADQIPESTKSDHVVWTVDTTSYLRNLDSEDLRAETFAVHHQAAPEETETGTRISLRFPTLIVSCYCSEPREVADRVARILNAHWDEPAAPPAMDREAVVLLKDGDADPYSFSSDEDEDGFVISQHRFYKWGDDCIIAVGELNAPNTWDDEAFDAKCQTLLSTLSADAIRKGEGKAREWPDIGDDPMKSRPFEDRMAVSADAIRKAYTVQQPIVPDQTALVWRWHLGALLEAEIRLRSILADEPATPASHASDGGKA